MAETIPFHSMGTFLKALLLLVTIGLAVGSPVEDISKREIRGLPPVLTYTIEPSVILTVPTSVIPLAGWYSSYIISPCADHTHRETDNAATRHMVRGRITSTCCDRRGVAQWAMGGMKWTS